ncbi:hypothetical protein GBAR_LOCUS27446, partial [Geodia barretti]
TKHSSGAKERFEGEHCELCASLQKLYVCIPGGISSRTGTRGEDQILQISKDRASKISKENIVNSVLCCRNYVRIQSGAICSRHSDRN